MIAGHRPQPVPSRPPTASTYAYRRFGDATARAAGAVPPALPRQPRQLGPGARRPIAAEREVILLDNAGVGGSTGTTRGRSRRWPGTRSPSSTRSACGGRRLRVLDRRLRRPGAHAASARSSSAASSWRGPARRAARACTGWIARRARAHAMADEPGGGRPPRPVLRAPRRRASPRDGSSSSASSPAPRAATRRPRSPPATRSSTPSRTWGIPDADAARTGSPASRSPTLVANGDND